jgi:signal transduction histidine kinase
MAQRLRTLLFLVAAIPLGALGASLLLAGWLTVLLLAITPLAVPALVGFRAAVGGVAWAESWLSNALLGTQIRPQVTSPGRGYWRRGLAVLESRSFWTQQVYLLQRFVLGGTLAVAETTLLATGAGAVTFPLYYRWTDTQLGSWHVDTLAQSLLWVPPGVVALAAGVALLRPLRFLFRSQALGLLGGSGKVRFASTRAARRGLAIHVGAVVGLNALLLAIWAVTPHGAFWPVWTFLSTGLALALHAWVVLVTPRHDGRFSRGVILHEGVALSLLAFLVGVWAASGFGTFWPIWVLVAFAITLAGHLALEYASRRTRRITQLEETRAGIVDQQETELRRIERDLHDGAQATLVALGMSIGMAEQKLASDPAGAQELLADARRSAQDALHELRDLARGIHPPVLADRGLEAAISALAARSPLHVDLTVALSARPPAAVETAAYFVVAESLANTGKHAGAHNVAIELRERAGELVVRVSDDGRGGADSSGNGLGGLRRRVAALDGTFSVTSPRGGPTTVEAVLPCAR